VPNVSDPETMVLISSMSAEIGVCDLVNTNGVWSLECCLDGIQKIIARFFIIGRCWLSSTRL